jgi:ribosome maturation factor RimP
MAQRGRGAAASAAANRSAGKAAGQDPARGAGKAAGLDAARLRPVVEPVVRACGLDLDELRVHRVGSRQVVRVIVDTVGGVSLDAIAEVSRRLSNALDEADGPGSAFGAGAYTLEVSSPGVDRPLTQPRHWQRNVGRLISARFDGATVTGRLLACSQTTARLEVAGVARDLPLDRLGPGRVQVEFGRVAELSDDEIGEEIRDEYGEFEYGESEYGESEYGESAYRDDEEGEAQE